MLLQKKTYIAGQITRIFFQNLKIQILLITVLYVFALTGCMYLTKRPEFKWPVKASYRLSRKFSIYHTGIDFPKKTGAPVLSTSDGEVIYTGDQFSGYGKMILIKHSNDWSSLYAHLSKIHVKAGQRVHQGQKIGEVGNTGRSTAPHLHFELIYDKQPVNPVRFLKD